MHFIIFYVAQLMCILHFNLAVNVTNYQRFDPVKGQTYFASDKLLQSKIKGAEEYISVFSLPKEGVTVNGTFSEISTKLQNLLDSKISLNPLVLKIDTLDYRVFESLEAYRIFAIESLVNFTALDLRDVKELWIFSYTSIPTPLGVHIVTEKLTNLESLHVISHETNNVVTFDINFLKILPKLKVLDIQTVNVAIRNTTLYAKKSLILETADCISLLIILYGIFEPHDFWKNNELEILSLRNLVLGNEFAFKNENLHRKLQPHNKLKYLCISDNYLVSELPMGLNLKMPNLEVLDISHNLDGNFRKNHSYSKFMLENLMFHQSLKVFICSNIITSFENSMPHGKKEIYNLIPESSVETFLQSLELTKTNCSLVSDQNSFKTDKELQCNIIKCILQIQYLNCETRHLEFDDSCSFGVANPISPKLEEIYTGNLFYNEFGVDAIWLTGYLYLLPPMGNIFKTNSKNACLAKNSLKRIDFTYHTFTTPTSLSVILESDGSVTGLDNIEEFKLNYVIIDHELIFKIFSKPTLPNLRHLHLRGNSLTLPDDLGMCRNLHFLTTVDLSENKIKYIPEHLLDNCTHLRRINLSHNRIRTLPPRILKIIGSFDIKANLSDNLLSCECHDGAIETLTWLQKHHYKYENFSQYLCYGWGEDKFISDLVLDDHIEACEGWLWHDILALCLSTSICTIILIVIVRLSYKYRYILIVNCFKLKRILCGSETQKRATVYMFELYVSYCNENRIWVHHMLLPELERNGINCCIHYRDFPVCGSISDVIYRYMGMSRYILVILSQYSINKRWPAFELERAQELHRRDGKKVFYIKLGDLGTSITREVAQVLDSEIYIEWPEDTENTRQIEYFFTKLVAGIRGKQLRGLCCRCPEPSSRKMPPFDDQNVEMLSHNFP